MRLYRWGDEATGPQDKYYVLGTDEALMDVHKATGTAIKDMMKWNDIRDTRQLQPGMRLIVAKGNPEELTKGEKTALERERRMAGNAAAQGTTKASLLSSEDAGLLHPSRLQKLVSEESNPDSLANRLFGQSKKDVELFPVLHDAAASETTLANRLQRSKEALGTANNPHVSPSYILSAHNIDEWGSVSDSLMLAMIEMYVEREVFYVLRELLKKSVLKESIGGRMRSGGKGTAPAVGLLKALEKIDETVAET
jgi:hypothetical protein